MTAPALFGPVRVVVYDPATGLIEYTVRAPVDVAHLQHGDGQAFLLSDDGDDGAEAYVVGGALVPRPRISVPVERQVRAGFQWSLDGIPDGTEVRDEPGGFMGTASGGLTRVWAVPGFYVMTLEPPAPWIGATCRVEVIP